MEGIRLRSDSTGSTKNAFYQGTIVSNSRHSSEGENGRQFSESSDEREYHRHKGKVNNGYGTSKHPPRPRRHPKNDPHIISTPEKSNGEDDAHFEFSQPPIPGSLPHSMDSPYGNNTQLIGGSFNNSSWSSTGGFIPEVNTNNSRFEVPNSIIRNEVAATTLDMRPEWSSSSGTAFSSGVYFHQSAPPAPLFPGAGNTDNMQLNIQPSIPLMSNGVPGYYPSLQPSNDQEYTGYGSFDALLNPETTPLSAQAPSSLTIDEDDNKSLESLDDFQAFYRIHEKIDIIAWLLKDVAYDIDGLPFFESTSNWTFAALIRWLLYNPLYPEFTSLQQFCWAVVLGVFMGIFTAAWKLVIDTCVEFTWQTVPEKLHQWGLFTDLNGSFPLYHYMWITPGLLSGILAYISNSLRKPIPTQDDWIHTVHSNGIQESDTFLQTFMISTIGMTSGLSLGPELPLVLTAGMIGSGLGRACRQSLLQARVMNLTAASAAIGGMFGFPLAGGIFVMELPHRMGLQYFEALSPATIASIVAVLINRIVINDDVTGMFQYPFLSESLPSYIFKDAIIYGIFGSALGMFYTYSVKKIKKFTHHLLDCFGLPTHCEHSDSKCSSVKDVSEKSSTLPEKGPKKVQSPTSPFVGIIPHAPLRAALTSSIAGIAVGIIGIFVPHVMFWGEAQLQTMIDKRTPLPIFGQDDAPTADLVALGHCMMDGSKESELSMQCSITVVFAKIVVTGLSLGTGIVGGHFWAPLFVGAAASQFFTEVIGLSSTWLGISTTLTEYPCVALLCIMGATHVVIFRAHMAIILILTLTIDAFVPEDYALRNIRVAGDYSAVFPLLTVAVFVALQISRQTTFYEKQRCRGDIQALPEALCEPGKEGKPLVMDYDGNVHALHESDYEYESDTDDNYSGSLTTDDIYRSLSQDDIEASFQHQLINKSKSSSPPSNPSKSTVVGKIQESSQEELPGKPLTGDSVLGSSVGVPPLKVKSKRKSSESKRKKRLQALDHLLNGSIQTTSHGNDESKRVEKKKRTHRRTKSEPFLLEDINNRMDAMLNSSSANMKKPSLKRVDSFGEIDQGQPSLMDQARRRAASFAKSDNGTKKNY